MRAKQEATGQVIHCSPVVSTVDHGTSNILIHEKEQRETKSKSHCTKYGRPFQIGQWRRFEDVIFNQFEFTNCINNEK